MYAVKVVEVLLIAPVLGCGDCNLKVVLASLSCPVGLDTDRKCMNDIN